MFGTKAPGQLNEVRLDAGADLPAIAGTSSPSCLFGVQNQSLPSVSDGLYGRMQSSVTGTNDGYVYLPGELNVRKNRPWGTIPPVREILIVRSK